ncbi:MAG: hypothetical protein LBK91_07730, partial [Synergistaceae bacterium]|nr:hypothetical protein [Synergistaceae bacterium]
MYRKPKLGLITISDNREKAHKMLYETNKEFEEYAAAKIRERGEIDVVVADTIVHTAREAAAAAKQIMASDVDGVVLNFSIWTYPNLAVIAARQVTRPILMLSNLNPVRCGLVGMMASAGSLDQLGIKNSRVWGDLARPEVYDKVSKFARAAKVVNSLNGSVYGMFGGRSMGMYTGVAEQSTWMKKFGIDCEHLDEMEIIRLAQIMDKDRVERAFKWLSHNIRRICYDGAGLTEDKLRFQIACYLATKDLVKERELD